MAVQTKKVMPARPRAGLHIRAFADLHLHEWVEGATVDAGHNSRLRAQVAAITEMASAPADVGALALHPDALSVAVVCGDIVHSRRGLTPAVVLAAYEAVRALAASHDHVVVIPGNHDYPSKTAGDAPNAVTILREVFDPNRLDPKLANVTVAVQPMVVTLGGSWAFHLLPWQHDKAALAAAAEDLSAAVRRGPGRRHVLLSHFAPEGVELTDGVFARNFGLPLGAVCADAYDLVLLGDIHRRQQLADNAWMIGAAMQHTRNEAMLETGALDFAVSIHAPAVAGPILVPTPLTCPRFATVEVSTQAELDDAVAAAGEGLLVAVKLAPGSRLSQAAIAASGLPVLRRDAEPEVVVPAAYDGVDVWAPAAKLAVEYAKTLVVPDDVDAARVEAFIQRLGDKAEASAQPVPGVHFLEVSASNFLGYPSLGPLRLDVGRAVFVDGVVDGDDTVGSNGAGKSTMIDAVAWALFGRTFRGGAQPVRVDDVRFRDAPPRAATSVCVRFRAHAVPGVDFRVTRTLGKGVVIEEVTRGLDTVVGRREPASVQAANAELIQLTGFDFDLFRRVCVFGQENAESVFGAVGDADRRDMLDALVGGARFEPLRAAARLAASEADARRESATRTRLRLTGSAEALRSWSAETAVNLAALRERVDSVGAALPGAKARLAAAEGALAAFYSEHGREAPGSDGVMAAKDAAAKAATQLAQAEAGFRATERRVGVVYGRYATVAEASRRAGHDANAETCPTCGQPLTTGDAVVRVRAEAKRLACALAACAADSESAKAALDESRRTVEELRAVAAKASEAVVAAVAVSGSWNAEHQRLMADRAGAEADVRQAVAELEQHKATAESEARRSAKLLADLDEAVAGLAECASEEAEAKSACAIASYVANVVLAPSGVRAWLLGTVLPRIEAAARDFLRLVSAGSLDVRLALRCINDKHKIDYAVEQLGGGPDYRAISGGQKRKVDLAVAFAVAGCFGTACNVLWVDEGFDGLDSVASARVAAALAGRTSGGTVFVISHNSSLADAFPEVWTAVRRLGASRMEVPA